MTQNTLNDEIKGEETNFVEKGAALEHERWAKWQQYFFSKCQIKPQSQVGGMDDRYVYFALPKDLYERWQRQIATPYSELSETEKESDRKEARTYLPLLHKVARSIAEKTVEAVRVEEAGITKLSSEQYYKDREGFEIMKHEQNLRIGFNQAITEQSKKAKEWLGEDV